jgi:hypothetical protein
MLTGGWWSSPCITFSAASFSTASMKGVYYGRWAITHMHSLAPTPGLEGSIYVTGAGHGAEFFDLPEQTMSEILCRQVERTTLPFLRDEWFTDRPEWHEKDRVANARTRHLCTLLDEENYGGIADLLHEWEAVTARNFKVEHVWEPTPFPFEEGGA